MFCPKCGLKLQDGAQFCSECGQHIVDGVERCDTSMQEELASLKVTFKPVGILSQQIPGRLVLTKGAIAFVPSSINDWMVFTSDKEVSASVCSFAFEDVESVFVRNGIVMTSVFVVSKIGESREYIAGGKFAYRKPAEIFVAQVNNVRFGKTI